MGFSFGANSLARLATVKPELRALAQRAIELTTVDFGVVQGGRTLDQQMRLYGQGRDPAECAAAGIPQSYAQPAMQRVTWTLKSNHLADPADGLGSAIDVCPYIDGAFNWDEDGSLSAWPQIAAAFKAASADLGVKVFWGGEWQGKKDRPHFALKNG